MKTVTAALIIKDDKILICQRSKDDKQPEKWEFPGGKIEPGETLEECLVREIREELNIDIDIDVKFGESIYEYPSGVIRLVGFLAKWRSGEIKLNVHDDCRWVSRDELKEFDFAPADIPFVDELCKKDR